MQSEDKKLLLRLPIRLHDALKKEAKVRGLTVSALTRIILQDSLAKKYRERDKT